MGYTYAVSLVSVGILAVLMLALLTEHERKRMLQQALSRIPGFRPSRLVSVPGAVVALDDTAGIACIASVDNTTVRVDAARFDQVLESEILRNGQRVTRAVSAAQGGAARLQRLSATAAHETVRTPMRAPSGSDGERIALRVVLDHATDPVHTFHMRSMSEAVRWHVLVKQLMERTAAEQTRQPPERPESREQAVPTPRSDPGHGAVPAAARARGGRFTVDEGTERVVRETLSAVLTQELQQRDQLVIPERRLRDRCGLELPIIRFHDCMNRIKRKKALGNVAMTYSRRDETWRIRKKVS